MLHGHWVRPGLPAGGVASVTLCGSRLRRPTESPARRFQVECGLGKKHKAKQKRQAAAQPKEGAAPDIVPAQPAPRIDTSQLRLRTWKRLLKQVTRASVVQCPAIRGAMCLCWCDLSAVDVMT
jgi:hypothetical protein